MSTPEHLSRCIRDFRASPHDAAQALRTSITSIHNAHQRYKLIEHIVEELPIMLSSPIAQLRVAIADFIAKTAVAEDLKKSLALNVMNPLRDALFQDSPPDQMTSNLNALNALCEDCGENCLKFVEDPQDPMSSLLRIVTQNSQGPLRSAALALISTIAHQIPEDSSIFAHLKTASQQATNLFSLGFDPPISDVVSVSQLTHSAPNEEWMNQILMTARVVPQLCRALDRMQQAPEPTKIIRLLASFCSTESRYKVVSDSLVADPDAMTHLVSRASKYPTEKPLADLLNNICKNDFLAYYAAKAAQRLEFYTNDLKNLPPAHYLSLITLWRTSLQNPPPGALNHVSMLTSSDSLRAKAPPVVKFSAAARIERPMSPVSTSAGDWPKEKQRLEDQINMMQREKTKLENDKGELQALYDELLEQNNDLYRQILELQHTALQAQFDPNTHEGSDQAPSAKRRKVDSDDSPAVDDLKRQIETLTRDLSEARNLITQQESEINGLRKAATTPAPSSSDANQDMLREARDAAARYKADRERLAADLRQAQEDSKRLVDSARDSSRREIQARDEKINKLEQENKSLFAQTQQMKANLNAAADLRARIADARQDADRRIAETLALLQDYKLSISIIEASTKEKMDALSDRLANESRFSSFGASSRIPQLEEDLEKMAVQLQEATMRANNLQAENDSVKRHSSELLNKNIALQNELRDLKAKVEHLEIRAGAAPSGVLRSSNRGVPPQSYSTTVVPRAASPVPTQPAAAPAPIYIKQDPTQIAYTPSVPAPPRQSEDDDASEEYFLI